MNKISLVALALVGIAAVGSANARELCAGCGPRAKAAIAAQVAALARRRRAPETNKYTYVEPVLEQEWTSDEDTSRNEGGMGHEGGGTINGNVGAEVNQEFMAGTGVAGFGDLSVTNEASANLEAELTYAAEIETEVDAAADICVDAKQEMENMAEYFGDMAEEGCGKPCLKITNFVKKMVKMETRISIQAKKTTKLVSRLRSSLTASSRQTVSLGDLVNIDVGGSATLKNAADMCVKVEKKLTTMIRATNKFAGKLESMAMKAVEAAKKVSDEHAAKAELYLETAVQSLLAVKMKLETAVEAAEALDDSIETATYANVETRRRR